MMFMQEINKAAATEFAAEELADDAAVNGQTSTFGSLLQHFAEDLCLRRSALGYTCLVESTMTTLPCLRSSMLKLQTCSIDSCRLFLSTRVTKRGKALPGKCDD